MSNSHGFSLRETRTSPRPSFLNRSLGHLVDRVRRFHAVNELEQLSDRQLRDIGVERPMIEQIAEREIASLRARASRA